MGREIIDCKANDHIVIKTLIIFFTVFSIHFKSEPVTPRIFVLILVVLYTLFKSKGVIDYNQKNLMWLISCIVVLLFTAFSMYLNNVFGTENETALSSAFNFFIFVGIFPLLISKYFNDDIEFCKALTYAGTIQSIIVILSAMTPQMRSWLENVQDIDFSRYGYRIVGLGIAGAGGSVYLTCGLIAVAYWMISTKRVSGVTVLCFVIQFVAIAFVGRTGFYAAIVILFITFICLGNSCGVASLKLFGYLFLLMAIFIVLYNIVLAMYEIDTDILKYTYNRLWEIFEDSDSSTVQTLQRWNSMLPSINLRMFLLGTGVTRGTSFDGLRISHDGGYAKRYASIGLMMAIYSYLSYYRYVFKYIKLKFDKSSRFFMYFVVVIMIVIEYKEPFMYQLALPFTVLMISSLGEVSKVE